MLEDIAGSYVILIFRRHNIISISIMLQKIYRFNVIATKILVSVLGRNWQMGAKMYGHVKGLEKEGRVAECTRLILGRMIT